MTPESKLSGAHSHEHNWYNNQCQSPTNSWFFLTGIPVVKSPYVCPFSLHVSSKKSIKFHQFPICLKLDSPFVSWENYDSKLTFALVSLTFRSSKVIFSFFPLNTQHSTFPNWNVHLFSRKSAPLFQRWHPQNLATAKALNVAQVANLSSATRTTTVAVKVPSWPLWEHGDLVSWRCNRFVTINLL